MVGSGFKAFSRRALYFSSNEGVEGRDLNLRTLFNRFGHWHRANQIIDIFLKLSQDKENWNTFAQFHIQQAKFKLLQGEFLSAKETLLDIERTVQSIEPLFDRKRTEAMRLNTLGGAYQKQGDFDNAVQTFQKLNPTLL